jgi:hypothetical protein
MIIAVDFDGTCVTHEFPRIGSSIGAEYVLHRLTRHGHQLILWTVRSGDHLNDAVRWFEHRNIPLFGVNKNPMQYKWSNSPKAFAQLYIDDAAAGTPLVHPEDRSPEAQNNRHHVDWERMETILTNLGCFSKD